MKKIFLILISLIFIISCNNSEKNNLNRLNELDRQYILAADANYSDGMLSAELRTTYDIAKIYENTLKLPYTNVWGDTIKSDDIMIRINRLDSICENRKILMGEILEEMKLINKNKNQISPYNIKIINNF